ncbi:MAG: CAP domain-containing protein [Defluviitaleaceae bacterium]|nr:CAP domain-containing protein [Defluviitaleaceae bacterium]
MKKIFGFISVLILTMGLSVAVQAANVGDVVGTVLHTDIRVEIDGVAIAGYNIEGSTYVIATQLNAYGFVTAWDEELRRVDIFRGISSASPLPVPVNQEPIGSVAFYVLYTDIVTYVYGQRVSSFNLGGRTAVSITQVAAAASADYLWNGYERLVSVTTFDITDADITDELFRLINEHRAANGVSPLVRHYGLLHAQGMAHTDGFTVGIDQRNPHELFDWIIGSGWMNDVILSYIATLGDLQIEHGAVVFRTATFGIFEPWEFEQQIFHAINAQRALRGLSQLQMSPDLRALATARAQNRMSIGFSQNLSFGLHGYVFTNNIHPVSFVRQFVDHPDAHLHIFHPEAVSVGIGVNFGAVIPDYRTRMDVSVFFETIGGEIPAAANPFSIANLDVMGLIPRSQIVLPTNRVTTTAERQAWIAEYNAMGGASAFEREVTRLVSEYRVSIGLSPVTWEPTLAMAARYYTQLVIHIGYTTAQRTATNNAHNQGPHGTSVNTARSFGANITWGGNAFFPGGNTPEAIVNGWINSPGHRNYMVSPNHRYIGSGMSLNEYGRGFNYLFMSANPS